MKFVSVASAVALVAAQQKGTQTAEKHPSLSWSTCTAPGSCSQEDGKVTIDANWRWTHKKGETTNCYTGNKWDASLCPDAKTCTENCVIEGADQEYTNTYGVQASGNKLQLDFVTQGPYSKNIGSRTYLMKDDYAYHLFQLKNKEFTYTVDDTTLDCGLNGALYFVQMDADGGKSKYGNAGAEMGLGYCDAQCPHDLKFINNEANMEDWKPSETDPNAGTGKYGSCCTEIDIWEANKISTAYTMHACSPGEQTRCSGTDCGDNGPDRFKGLCDKNGCDLQSHRLGNTKFFGPGSDFQVDSTKPITVTTQFITNDGTDNGKLTEVKQFYTQGGKTIEHPAYTVNGNQHKTITDDFCNDWVATTQDGTNFEEKGGMGAIEEAIDAGVVLVMSLWDDHYANMLWLDSTYPVDSTDPGAARGSCPTTSGVPKDVESKQASSHVIFSDIKFGPIGSTISGGPSPAPTPSPSPSPTPSPSDCPGGSLDACIDLCPADVFAECVKSCQRRCASAVV
jgi:cellulose 1,4-beta-cellobiosidase